MARLLVFVLLALFALAVARGWLRANLPRPGTGARPPESIVRCEVCGLNLPQSEAFARAGLWYCSREHLESQ